jgi:hypothetical protein
MNGHSKWGQTARRFEVGRRSLGVAIAFAAIVMLLPARAEALAISPSGQPGTTSQNPWVVLEGPHLINGTSHLSYAIISGARRVNESAAYWNINQYVCVTHRLWIYIPETFTGPGYRPAAWSSSPIQQRMACGWILAAQTSINDLGAYFEISGSLPGSDYGVDVKIVWRSSPSGSVLGSATYDYASTTDYRCTYHPCTASDDGNGLGAYVGW